MTGRSRGFDRERSRQRATTEVAAALTSDLMSGVAAGTALTRTSCLGG